MYSSNCGFLPGKKQSNFSATVPHNFSLLRNFSNKSVSSNKFSSASVSSSAEGNSNLHMCSDMHGVHDYTSGVPSIMSFVYTFSGSSKTNMKPEKFNNLSSSNPSQSLIVHYNSLPSIPIVPSHLVGGFVGSKSQLGRRTTQGFEIKMWDMIRGLLSLVRNSPSSAKGSEKPLPMDKSHSAISSSSVNENSKISSGLQRTDSTSCLEKEKQKKQSYAEITKLKLPLSKFKCDKQIRPIGNCFNSRPSKMTEPVIEIKPNVRSMSVIEPDLKCSNQYFSQSRDRITSECSADSEDSFIVFENCEDLNASDDISYSSDDEDCRVSRDVSRDSKIPTGSSAFGKSCKPSGKKVRFAEGKSLEQVHPMIMWDYAYRKARTGPWEMLARDSERFRCRIAHTEAILAPVLEPRHRDAVYHQRFSSGSLSDSSL